MTLLLLYLMLALVVSFLCSVAEAVFLSARSSHVLHLVQSGVPWARKLLSLQAAPDKPLAAILTLNTIAHTVGAAGAGAQAALVFGDAWVGAFSAVLTFLILVLSEIIPKTLGATYWRALLHPVTIFIEGLAVMLAPFVWMSRRLTRLIAPGGGDDEVSREEIVALMEAGAEGGHIGGSEVAIVRNLMRLDRVRVRDVMTPRPVVFALHEDTTVSALMADEKARPFSRIPIHGDDADAMTGFILKQDVMLAQAEGRGETPLKALKRDFLAVPPGLTLIRLLKHMVDGHHHIALVFDEFGGFQGVVSQEDLFETLIGLEIMDESDRVADLRALAAKGRRRHMTE
ncbi:CNNM domain-containing protein [Yunchengibacter salinarum]|uniref:CNNM domain-containing protein n=1 Tax=Yunchengibacter salinarum TaxID=3133399 RepID=UPI0035B69D1D